MKEIWPTISQRILAALWERKWKKGRKKNEKSILDKTNKKIWLRNLPEEKEKDNEKYYKKTRTKRTYKYTRQTKPTKQQTHLQSSPTMKIIQ